MPRYHRKVFRVRAVDSPNVAWVLEQKQNGIPDAALDLVPVVPGILTWEEYCLREKTWDKVRKCIGLLAEFWEGGEVLLFPPDRLDRAERLAAALGGRKRQAAGIGIDSAGGGDRTAFAACDALGVIEVKSILTADTSEVTGETIAFGRAHGCPPERWLFDAGGGGTQHADRLRKQGYPCATCAFGSAPSIPLTFRKKKFLSERKDLQESKYAYKNKRAELWHNLARRLDPTDPDFPLGFGIPYSMESEALVRLRGALAVVPRLLDDEGRYWLPSKGRVTDDMAAAGIEETLTQIIGYSPDEADAVVLALEAMTGRAARRRQAGVM